jgi:hypothetical protein
MTFRKPTLAAGVLAALLAVGCDDNDKSSTSSSRDRDRDGVADKYDRHPNSSDRLDDDVVIGRDRDRLDRVDRAGSTRGLDEIPRDALRVHLEDPDHLRHKPDHDGRIYVFDEDADRVVYDGRLKRGENFVAEPGKDAVTIDGKRIGNANLNAKHHYRLYFLRADTRL